jgi:hypothetical protein
MLIGIISLIRQPESIEYMVRIREHGFRVYGF